ncbi:MAG: YcxB family protein [Vitreimonas sp.]
MSEPIVVEARRDRDDMHSAAWLVFWYSRAWVWLLLASVVLGILAWPNNGMTGAVAAVIGSFGLLMMGASGLVIDRGDRGAKGLAGLDPTIHRFSSQGVEIEIASLGTAHWQWSAFIDVVDNDRVLLLRRPNNYPIVIPKRQIGANWSRLKALLNAALNERAVFKGESAA